MKKWLNKLLIMTFIAFTLISPIQVQAAAKNRYYAIALADPNTMTTSYQVYKIDDNTKVNKYKMYLFGSWTDSRYLFTDPLYDRYKWPNIPYGEETSDSLSDNDLAQADSIMSEATNQINTLINWLDRWSEKGIISGYQSDVAKLYEDLSSLFSMNTTTIAGTSFTVKQAEADNPVVKKFMEKSKLPNSAFKGVLESDFITISPEGLDKAFDNKDSKITVLSKLPKGYYKEGEKEQRFLKEEVTGYPSLLLSDLTLTISNAFKNKLTFNDFYETSSTEDMMDEMFGGFTTSLLKFFGFDQPEELVYNQGERGTGYYLGIMPNSWWTSVNQFFWVAEIIAILILFISVVNMILKQNLATISPTIRNSLKDSIAQLCIAILLLISYIPIFYVLAKTNYILVEMFESFTSSFVFTNSAGSFNWLIKIILVGINMGIIIKLNIDYFVRSVMVAFLHATAPIFISSIAMGSNGKKMFNSWLRELVGSIFMQSFNAMILAIALTTIGAGVGSKWWHTQAIIFMLSSLNTWFRNLIGVGDSIASIGGQVKQQADKGWDQAKKVGGVVAGAGLGAVAVGAGAISSSAAAGATKAGASAGQTGAKMTQAANAISKDVSGLEKGNVSTQVAERSVVSETGSSSTHQNVNSSQSLETTSNETKNASGTSNGIDQNKNNQTFGKETDSFSKAKSNEDATKKETSNNVSKDKNIQPTKESLYSKPLTRNESNQGSTMRDVNVNESSKQSIDIDNQESSSSESYSNEQIDNFDVMDKEIVENIHQEFDNSDMTLSDSDRSNNIKENYQEFNKLNNEYEKQVKEMNKQENRARTYGKIARGANAMSQSLLRSSLRGTGLDAVADEFNKEKNNKYKDMSEFSLENQYSVGKKPNRKQEEKSKLEGEIKDDKK